MVGGRGSSPIPRFGATRQRIFKLPVPEVIKKNFMLNSAEHETFHLLAF